ncbi:Protein MSP1-like protein 2 [Colletotrichum chlorophyti]|uniref:Protein MSP1-like protein 2 n=1 Tax=Colletotrichum chlorophyti TaxID=708187 RepID=A0A1Q8R9E5_9PEZI|nr:Protein MSP1-like protein 2 [Colletotrichum chlorophyti]
MANWKELGEVPDSDDDLDFDSQESETCPKPDLPTTSLAETSKTTNDDVCASIWDVPESSQDVPAAAFTKPQAVECRPDDYTSYDVPVSSPLSSVPDDDELEDPFEREKPEHTRPQQMRLMRFPDNRDDSPDPLAGDDCISTSYVRITAPQSDFPADNDTGSLLPPSLAAIPQASSQIRSPRSSQSRSQPGPSASRHQTSSSRAEEVARRVERRYERSFRPRKPIQEHPYLIENAQYSKTLKSHGIKPIRMPSDSVPRRQRPEQDSQDKDFEEESQGTIADAPNENTDDSQFNGLEEPPSPGFLRMSLSPSPSPLRTSSPKHQGGPSSQTSQGGETENTSLSENEELPSLDEIHRNVLANRPTKKRRLVGVATSRPEPTKLTGSSRPIFRQYDDIPGILSSSPSTQPQASNNASRRDSAPLPEADGFSAPFFDDDEQGPGDSNILPLAVPERQVSTGAAVVDLTMADLSSSGEDDGFRSDSDQELESSEMLRNVGRRIRGVLPASWLRLDQQGNRYKPPQHQHRDPSPEKTPRRGVAIKRVGRTTSASAIHLFSDDSDDEMVPTPHPIRSGHIAQGGKLTNGPSTEIMLHDEDGALSVVEDNQIDHMLPSKKRQLTLNESFRQPVKRQKQSNSTLGNQTKKLGRLLKTANRSSEVTRLEPRMKNRKSATGSSRSTVRTNPPPQLSILDVIEPDAPQFLKIAARAAQKRRHLGRSSPNNKTIRLATRKDNVDAGTVLQNWKGGKIRPRQGLQKHSTQTKPPLRNPLAQISSNVFSQATKPSKDRNATQPNGSHHGASGPSTLLPEPRPRPQPLSRSKSTQSQRRHEAARPAQLEVDVTEQTGSHGFHAKKRAIDALFRRSRRQSMSARSAYLYSVMDDACSVASGYSFAPRSSPEPSTALETCTRRPKKSVRPIRVDVAAAQFHHADDPLPYTELLAPAEISGPQSVTNDNQLLGLGPFGTHYTQHFEIFPLDRGVFFHETTLIGSGRVQSLVDDRFPEKLWQPRPRISFHLGEQTLHWDTWNEQVSSELGILMDGILDQITTPVLSAEPDLNTKDAAQFVLDYVLRAMSFADNAAAVSFVTRFSDVTRAFVSRVDTESIVDLNQRLRLVEVFQTIVLVNSCAVRLCQKTPSLTTERFALESVLRKAAESFVGVLLEIGLGHVVLLYDELQGLRYRERGIRPDKLVPHAWVLLMKVTESLRIPRMGFWDVAYSRMIQHRIIRGVDASEFEQLWKTMFILLPLGEFDNSGVVVADRRHHFPMEGWTLPQLILKRVFELYRENPRQPASFNDYCRALVSRCHYLVDQWGWQKCGALIGTIFDFFGSQNLSHLRNEEAFRSARFLDSLHLNPSLKVDSDDRCFHIFLKLVALTIKRLRQKGLINDIRNLVTRTLPNHDRQYSKEQNVHQHDLSALRNHHDLLCTLFWSAPPELRPSVHNLEKLVIPASSHKEACLINLRAWNQLARFVVHEESATSFLPMANWQANVFKQLLDQYNSAAADIQQQFMAMSKDVSSSISEELMNSIIAANKAATMEIMIFSVKSSMDVVQYAGSLELARLASNTFQIQEVFQHFSALPADFPPTLLQASLATVERLLTRIESVFNEADDSQDSMASRSMEWEDAILMLERDMAAVCFSMGRCLLSSRTRGRLGTSDISVACIEQTVIVSGIMTSLFVRCGMMRLSQIFQRSKFGLFENTPNKISLEQRQYVPLLLSIVAQKGAAINLDDIGTSLLELWLLIIVQPNRCLKFENQFGQQLQSQGYPFIPDKTATFVANPGYSSNRGFFEHAVSWMRQSLQAADAASKKDLLVDFERTLNTVMNQMRVDLLAMIGNSSEHSSYVKFVRGIISLIKAYGTDICPVHKFFLEVSKEYSPPIEDPHLQAALIQSYGFKLAEGDPRVPSTLFHFFLNNFKGSLQRNRLPHEVFLLRGAFKYDTIVSFVLEKMLPAVLHATLSTPEAYAMLDVFCDALGLTLTASAVARQVSEHSLDCISPLVTTVLAWAKTVKGTSLGAEQIHILRRVIWVFNALQPTLESFSLMPREIRGWDKLMDRLHWFSVLVEGARKYIDGQLVSSEAPTLSPAVPSESGGAEDGKPPDKPTGEQDDDSKNRDGTGSGNKADLALPDSAFRRSRGGAFASARARIARPRAADELPPVKLPQSFLETGVKLYDPENRINSLSDDIWHHRYMGARWHDILWKDLDVVFTQASWSDEKLQEALRGLREGNFGPIERRNRILAEASQWLSLSIDEMLLSKYPNSRRIFKSTREPLPTTEFADMLRYGRFIISNLLSVDAMENSRDDLIQEADRDGVLQSLVEQYIEEGRPIQTYSGMGWYDPRIRGEVITAVRADLSLKPDASAAGRELKRPLTVFHIPNTTGRAHTKKIMKYVANCVEADLIHLDAQELAKLVGDYIGQDCAYSRGAISMLGYRTAEMNGRLAKAEEPPKSNEEELSDGIEAAWVNLRDNGMDGSYSSPLDNELQKIRDGAKDYILPSVDRWENLKINAVLEEIANSASKISQPGRSLIIHVDDFVELNMTLEGALLLGRLRSIVDTMWRAGKKVTLVGTSANENPSEQYTSTLKEIAAEECLIPFPLNWQRVKSPLSQKQIYEANDYVRENMRNIQHMLRAIAGTSLDTSKVRIVYISKSSPPQYFIKDSDNPHMEVTVVPRVLATTILPLADVYHVTRLFYACQGSVKPEQAWRILLDVIESSSISAAQTQNRPQDRPSHSNNPTASSSSSTSSPTHKAEPERLRVSGNYNDYEKKLLSGLVNSNEITTTFDDVHAAPETKNNLKLLTSLSLLRPEAFTYGVLAHDRIPGCLLYGPPGTGKTLLAKAVAKESGANMLEVSGASINDMYVGQSEKNVRALFSLAKKLSPLVIFIDEADALLAARGQRNRTAHRETINQFLREWDGMSDTKAFIMVATNRPFDLDDAVLRRLPRKILVDLPLKDDRASILRILLKDEELDASVSIDEIARRTVLYSGSDLKNLCVAAAMTAVQEESEAAARHTGPGPYVFPPKRTLRREHFDKALQMIAASVSEDMDSLKSIRRFDEKYGDMRQRKSQKKRGMGFGVLPESTDAEEARVRQAVV